MLIFKLIVLFVYSELFNVFCVNYCEICVNHTFCLFPKPGPGLACKGYKTTSLLTNDNIKDIVNRINEKRNFIAMGRSKFFPQAANMKKMSWSHQLALFAQRWADQCDQSIYRDKEDYCRDLGDDVGVGQNIATIYGSTSGLNVKSFVDMWYMKSIDYTGNVTLYNRSRDQEAHYFTQLIWADTIMIGCGRAKFQIVQRNVTADKLVCNFAPKGNINGKPVYVIGYPATQCGSQQTEVDPIFPGLCVYINNGNEGKFTTQRPPVSSLLRILNLSNNSVKQEIDPIRSNIKQMNYEKNKTNVQRYQKIRHVVSNNTLGDRRSSSVKSENIWEGPGNRSRQNWKIFYHADRGHSRMYHEHHLNKGNNENFRKYDFTTEPITVGTDINEDFRKYDFSTEPITVGTDTNDDFRKYQLLNNRCTRKMGFGNNFYSTKYSNTNNCQTYKCTRSKFLQITHFCQTMCSLYINKAETLLHNRCLCNKLTTTQNPLSCNCDLHGQCLNKEIYPKPCTNLKKTVSTEIKEILKSTFSQYDIAPNLALQSDNKKESPGYSSSAYYTRNFNKDIEDYAIKQIFRRKLNQNQNYQKNVDGYVTLNNRQIPEHDFNFYDFLVPRQRKKRENIEQITLKPFWQVDQFNNLKSMRYTTLANRRNNKNTRRTTTSIKPSLFTEVITIKLKDLSTFKYERDLISEKYLSFDELMHIRKMSTSEIEYNARRKFNETNILRQDTTTTAVTTVAPIDTPFVRKKHCTRKLTCTWTSFTLTGSDGKVILPGGVAYGSKTPPGYVDGCTRTSTCTRDFQDRNKISTTPDPSSIDPNLEEQDYCEKRSIDVRKKDSNSKIIKYVLSKTKNYATTTFYDSQDYDYSGYETTPMGNNCEHELLRRKREEINHWNNMKNSNNTSSYGLYNLVVREIIKSWEDEKHLHKSSKCSCNTPNRSSLHICTLFLIIYELN